MAPIVPTDQRTRVAVRASYLTTALGAVRRAIVLASTDQQRRELGEAATHLSVALHTTEAEYDEIRRAEANVAARALEG